MKLSHVLSIKGPGVVTLWPTHTLVDAVRLFDDRAISSVVIVDPEGRPLGLITDRDVVHAVSRHGPSALAMGVTKVMTAPAPAGTPDMSVTQALVRMSNDRIRHLVVISDEEMIGIVSIGDLVKSKLQDAETEGRVLRELALARLAEA